MFTSNHTGRDSDTMLPLYMQDEMYRIYSLLVTEATMRTKIGNFDRGTATVVNKISYSCPLYFYKRWSKSILQDRMEALQTNHDSVS